MTVLVGGIPQTYARTGVTAVPASFVLIMVVVALLVVGLVAMCRYVPHPAPFYALPGRGLGPSAGVAGGLVALLAYNAIQISLFGLISTSLAGLAGGSWQGWAVGVWLLVGGLGLLRGAASARILGALLSVELAVMACFVVTAFVRAPHGVGVLGVVPSGLLVPGVSGVLALGIAAFVGVETPSAYAEEARPAAMGKAVIGAVWCLGVLYLLAAASYLAWAGGPSEVAAAAADPARSPIGLLGSVFGPGVSVLATMLLITSVLAAMSAFHGAVARYVFAMAREQVLPVRLAWVSRGGAPVGGSLVQSAIAAVVVAGFAVGGADPMAVMFTWLSTLGGLGVLVMLVVTALSARVWFANGGGAGESVWTRQIAPGCGAVLGVLLVAMTTANLGAVLGVGPGSWWPWLIPGLIGGGAVAGMGWGLLLRWTRRQVWAGVGRGTPDPLTVNDQRLAELKV